MLRSRASSPAIGETLSQACFSRCWRNTVLDAHENERVEHLRRSDAVASRAAFFKPRARSIPLINIASSSGRIETLRTSFASGQRKISQLIAHYLDTGGSAWQNRRA